MSRPISGKQVLGSFALGLCGLALLTIYAGWQVALGAFLLVWGSELGDEAIRAADGEDK